jgi:hypothetical protein
MGKILKKVISLTLVMSCIIMMSSISAFAAEDFENATVKNTAITRSVYQNEFSLTSNTDSVTVQLTKKITAGSTTKTYQVVKTGDDCRVVVKFLNQSTGKSYVLSLTADNGQYTEGIGVSVPAGTYTVSFASTPCTVKLCWCVFNF